MIRPTLQHAETHSGYLPRPPNPQLAEAKRIAETINATKISDPVTGAKVYDNLVDSLVTNTLAVAKQYEHAPEPATWTCPQRCVWRFSHLPYERRLQVVEDRSVAVGVKAFASINAGRWLVSCPWCNGAQYASVDDRRFWCVDCNSAAVTSQWVEVVWPDDPGEVEQWLMNRPNRAKNWNPGETSENIVEQDRIAGSVK